MTPVLLENSVGDPIGSVHPRVCGRQRLPPLHSFVAPHPHPVHFGSGISLCGATKATTTGNLGGFPAIWYPWPRQANFEWLSGSRWRPSIWPPAVVGAIILMGFVLAIAIRAESPGQFI